MAATDQTYRNQKMVDIVFAVTCILMLVSIVWMFAQDYYREYKVEIRRFRDVEEGMFNRAALADLPDPDEIKAAEQAVLEAQAAQNEGEIKRLKKEIATLLPAKVKADDAYQAVKADYDSKVSLYNIAVDEHGVTSSEATALKMVVENLGKELQEKLAAQENIKTNYDDLQSKLNEQEKPLTDAQARLKKLYDNFDRRAKNAIQKRWKAGDWFRSLPVIDAFASSTRIQQYTLNDLPIDYNFKQVTRYDRCATCHLGLERADYTKENLRALSGEPKDLQDKLAKAKDMLANRQKVLAKTGEQLAYDPSDLRLTSVKLSDKEINEYCAHPRLDLFVDANSPHSAEKFGCTVCHAGQGSATSFTQAVHSPNNAIEKTAWKKAYDWEPSHNWDFPMLPKRFVESSCLKCHHQVTDLIREGNRQEAPKLLRGYNLVRENGCFGCHEISGIKNGRWVGPDLRLEPFPPLVDLSPSEQVKALSDPLNPPGTMRKVGPSLRRITEKTNPDWVRKWIRSPRDFRPDTKMPHFYGLANNNAEALKGTGQEAFPDAEIQSITFYLFHRSQAFLADVKKVHSEKDPAATLLADREKYEKLFVQPLPKDEAEKAKVRAELTSLASRILVLEAAPPIAGTKVPPLPDKDVLSQKIAHGRSLFSEKGCLACHIHNGTTKPMGNVPEIRSDAHFGPNLSRLAAKLGDGGGLKSESARRWLIQWIQNPSFYHPRTFMPVTHLSEEQANDVALWLLSQEVTDWVPVPVPEVQVPELEKLARVHLDKVLTRSEVEALFDPKNEAASKRVEERLLDLQKRGADEGELAGGLDKDGTKLKMYLGRKAIGQLGCFACHDIPGFEQSKPIGTPLNDWGKKDPERLAFEDVDAYVKKHFYTVGKLTDKKGAPLGVKDGKKPYEHFFYEALHHQQRDGFLNQKLLEPRSYDYNRMRRWDDRLRMPQFRFARTEPREGEDPTEYEARRDLEEAAAREAVMTFILGLVAEPVPAKFVNEPTGDRKAEVKGRQVLDKFNCAGCHMVRPGVYEFKATPDSTERLQASYDLVAPQYKDDFHFLHSNAWVGLPPTRPNRLTAYGINPRLDADGEDNLRFFIQLTQAVRFTDKDGKILDLRAFSDAQIPPRDLILDSEADRLIVSAFQKWEAAKTSGGDVEAARKEALEMLERARKDKQYGGTFADLLADYAAQRYPARAKELNARAMVPPTLLREGEKTQPAWLYQFLRNPGEIRPQAVMDSSGNLSGTLLLRMPKFNMSDDEAMTLVNYFAAVDKVTNPAVTLNYPYMTVRPRQENYIQDLTKAYVGRLREKNQYQQRLNELQPTWDRIWQEQGKSVLEEQRKPLEQQIADKNKEIEKVKDDAAKTKKAQEELAQLQKQLDPLKNEDDQKKTFLEAQRKQWTSQDVYLLDGYRIITQTGEKGLCVKCHQVGNVGYATRQGPPLDLAWERLRPEWTEHWLGNPRRLATYPVNMIAPYRPTDSVPPEQFVGTPLEAVTGIRDALMNFPRLADMPVNRYRAGAGGK